MEWYLGLAIVAMAVVSVALVVRAEDTYHRKLAAKNQKIKDLERALRDANLRAERSIDWQD